MPRLRVQLFARAKELVGESIVEIDLESGSKVADLRRRLAVERPVLKGLLTRCALAVNEEFASDDTPLEAGQRLALLPPVSGGQ
jgi:molybdopterin converting factor subunit 1